MKKQLLLLGAVLLSTFSAWAQKSPYQGISIDDARKLESVWIYNVETGMWLQNNERKGNDVDRDPNWTTRAEVDTRGIDFQIKPFGGADPEASIIDPKFAGNGSMNHSNLYLDTGEPKTAWYFTPTENGVSNGYNILAVDGSNMKNLFVNADGYLTCSTENGTAATWQLVTREERIAKMVASGKPEDASWLISAPGFANADKRNGAWSRKWDKGTNDANPGVQISGDGTIHANRVQEFWGCYSMDMKQVIRNIPNGTYELTVQGFYRDGSINNKNKAAYFVIDRRNNGTEQLRAKYFANGAEAPLMSVIEGAKSAPETGFDTEAIDGEGNPSGLYFPDNIDAASYGLWVGGGNAYHNKKIKATVADGTLTIGIRKDEGVIDDWIIVDNFRLTYMGNQIDVTQVQEALNKAIETAETFTSAHTTTAALDAQLKQAIDAAKALTTSTDATAIATATTALQQALTAAQQASTNADLLNRTLQLAQNEKVSGQAVDNAVSVLEKATSDEEITAALDALRMARKKAHLETQENVFTGNAPAEADFYFYNVGTKMFLCGGNEWGTHASVGFPGVPMKLIAKADGYVIDTHLQNGEGEHFLNYGGFVDTGVQDVWQFESVGNGEYTIGRNSDKGKVYLGFNPERASVTQVDTDMPAENGDYNKWILVTRADRDALLDKASATNPVDATYYIKTPGFNQREDENVWTRTQPSDGGIVSIWGRGGNNPDFAFESFDNQAEFDLNQMIDGLKPGYYVASVQGLYRDSEDDEFAQKLLDGGTPQRVAKFYASNGDEEIEVELPAVTDGKNMAPGYGIKYGFGEIPTKIPFATQYFQNGAYKTSLTIQVGEDGALLIGVKRPAVEAKKDWLVVDNFRLTYYGKDKPTTGIEGIETRTPQTNDDRMYNLAGQRVDKSYKGVVIKNGKKIVVR